MEWNNMKVSSNSYTCMREHVQTNPNMPKSHIFRSFKANNVGITLYNHQISSGVENWKFTYQEEEEKWKAE